MTQSVVEKTSIPEKTWRRQTDSPFGWITFVCGSLILHLLAFWLISLYKLSASQSGSDVAVPIEFIEISPQKSSPVQPKPKPKPKPKAVIPKPSKPILPQNSQPPALPNVVKPPVITNDQDAIAFDNQKIEQQLAEQQRQQELLQQQQLAEQQRQLEANQQRQLAQQLRQRQAQQEKVEARLRQREQEQQRKLEQKQQQLEAQQLEQEAQQRKEAEQQRLREAQQEEFEAEQQRLREAQSRREADEQQNLRDGEEITAPIVDKFGGTVKKASVNQETPDSPVKNNQDEEIPLNDNQETQLNQSGGILTASWNIETDTFFKGKPDNLAKPQKRVNSDIPLPPPENGNLQLGDFLVWLTIDNQGNLLSIEVDKQIPLAQRSQYQEYAEKIFNGQKFIPASEDNGNKPDLSYLPIRVNIQSSSN